MIKLDVLPHPTHAGRRLLTLSSSVSFDFMERLAVLFGARIHITAVIELVPAKSVESGGIVTAVQIANPPQAEMIEGYLRGVQLAEQEGGPA